METGGGGGGVETGGGICRGAVIRLNNHFNPERSLPFLQLCNGIITCHDQRHKEEYGFCLGLSEGS